MQQAARRLFGTDGIRGTANSYPMTAELALRVGSAVGHVCRREPGRRHRVVIGKDTRLSGYMIETALTSGICSMGVDVLLLGPIPTPAVAFITRDMRADAGIVISASHNPYQDNGIKIFAHDGYKLSDEQEAAIENFVLDKDNTNGFPPPEEIGRAKRIDDAIGRYIVFCKKTFPDELTLDGMRMVIDCANGATYRVAPTIFSELGAHVTAIHNQPDGRNINEQCGSQHTGDLARMVKETNSDVGLAFDGDGDRLIAVDENGCELSGDHLLAICAKELQQQGRLSGNRLIVTPMSNFGLRLAMQATGIECEDAGVGDRLVLELMRKRGATLGGEQSGHIIFHEHHTTGDGIISALQLLSIMVRSKQKLSDLAQIFTPAPQQLINVDVKDKPPLESLPVLQQAIADAEKQLSDKGRVLVRYSGTQPMCRVMVESDNAALTDSIAKELAATVKKLLG